jgi:hypothetical protein
VASDEQSLLEAKTVASGVFRTARPARLLAFEDTIEIRTATTPVKKDVQRVRYDQVAQVSERLGVIFADLVVGTRGGDTLWCQDSQGRRPGTSARSSGNACSPVRRGEPPNLPLSTSLTRSKSWPNSGTRAPSPRRSSNGRRRSYLIGCRPSNEELSG